MLTSPQSFRFAQTETITNVTNIVSLRKRDRSWGSTPNYSKTRGRDLPINAYSDYQIVASASNGSTYYTGTSHNPSWNGIRRQRLVAGYGNDSYFDGFMYLALAPAHRSDSSMQNETMLKALSKIADAKTNLAVMYAEKAKTADLIYGTANRIYRAMSSFRRGRFKETAKILNLTPGTVHKTWLEYKYGWMPLLMDVKNSAEFFAQQQVGRPLSFSVNAKTEDPIRYLSGAMPGFNRNGFDTNLETLTYTTDQVKTCRVKIWCEITNPHLSQLQQLGVTNPALIAWELVPYSFVFDWFISVGDWLQGLTALNGITVKKAMVSFKKTVDGACTESFPGYAGFYDVYESWSRVRNVKIRRYSRSSVTVDPLELYPPVNIELPSWQRCVSGLALLRGNARSFGSIRV